MPATPDFNGSQHVLYTFQANQDLCIPGKEPEGSTVRMSIDKCHIDRCQFDVP